MYNFDISIENTYDESFRIAQLKSFYEYKEKNVKEHFAGSIVTPQQWTYGLIYGNSGTGKSTIAKKLGVNYIVSDDYTGKPVIDEFPSNYSLKEIAKMFTLVGFSSVPCWLKPYHVLSNGEKMRVDLAKALLLYDEFIFDEFTSVVDREAAQMMCKALNLIKDKLNKKIIFVTCHGDVKEYLNCDWVFCTDTMKNENPIEPKKKLFTLTDANMMTGQNSNVIII